MPTKILQAVFVIASCLCLLAGPTFAQSGSDTIQVAARAVSFLQPSLAGTVTAAIVYEPGDADSEREARAIERSLAAHRQTSPIILKPKRVSSASLDQMSGAKVAFVTRGTNYRQVGSAAAARSILTISFDPSCARVGHCVLAVSSSPKVQIFVSRSAAAAARLRFNASFLMLIKEI